MGNAVSQLELFAHVTAVYADSDNGKLTNDDLYRRVAERAGLDPRALAVREPIGKSGEKRSVLTRAVRWHQQTLKTMGVLQRVEGERGVWELVEKQKSGVHTSLARVKLVAFSTSLGVAIWGDCREVFDGLNDSISLVLTSPPFLLSQPRAYGNPSSADYIDFIIDSLKPLVRNLVDGGSVVLNIGQDIFEPGLPSRSMYCEELVLAIRDRLGLSLMDRIIWENRSRPPGPVAWASKKRVQLSNTYDPIFWFTNNPAAVRSDNRRVLEPHTEKHLKLIAAGGETRRASYSDGAYKVYPGSYSNPTAGRIPRNVLSRGHRCADSIRYREDARALGLPPHGAMMPLSIPLFFLRFLTEPGELVVDPFGGTVKTGRAAEQLGRRWLVADRVLDYLRAGGERFRADEGFSMTGAVEAWPRKST